MGTFDMFNKEVKLEGVWRFAADAAKITNENANGEDCKHTSGVVFVAIDSDIGAVVDKEEGAIVSTLRNEGRIAQHG